MTWSQELLSINPRAKVTVRPVGRGKVVLVDDFYLHPDRVLDLAQGLHYFSGAVHGKFPGARALVSLDTAPLCQVLGGLWGAPLEPFQPFGGHGRREYVADSLLLPDQALQSIEALIHGVEAPVDPIEPHVHVAAQSFCQELSVETMVFERQLRGHEAGVHLGSQSIDTLIRPFG